MESLLQSLNGQYTAGCTDKEFNALDWCAKNVPKTAARTGFETLPKVRFDGSETFADDRVVMGYIYLLVTKTRMALPSGTAKIRSFLD